MRYVRILLAGSIVWAAPAFSQTDGNSDCTSGDPDRMLTGCTSIIAGRVLQRKVSIASAYMNRGNAYDEKGDHDRAIADYTEAIRFNHRFVEAYDNRGFTYYLKGNYDRAIADYDEAIRLKPNNVFAYRNRGMAYRMKGDYSRAIADCDEAIRIAPGLAIAYTNRGQIYAAMGDRERAVSDFGASLSSTSGDPTDKWAHDAAKQKLAELEQHPPTQAETTAIPRSPDGQSDSGVNWVDCESGDLDASLAGCSAIITEGKESKLKLAMAYAYRGGAYLGKNYYDLAITDYDKAIQLNPDFALAYNGRGFAYATAGDRKRAITDLNHAIQLQPDLAQAYYHRGTVFDAKGDHDSAITDFDHAIRLKPDEAEVYVGRGNAYRAKGDYDRAIADLDQTIRLQPDAALAYTYRGLAYVAKGDRERAISDFRTALSSTNSDPTDKWALDAAKQKLAELEQHPSAQPATDVARPQLPDDKRIALVIGNSQYRSIPRLDNPVNDAKLMAVALKSLGFKLVGDGARLDLDKSSFDSAVQSFGNQLQGANVALFYYAGHGVQVRGGNYLVPVNANPNKEADADFQLLDVDLVLRQMEGSGTKLNIVMLDACRNNPFGGRGLRASGGGLAQMQAPEGTLISYATQPGNVAQDGRDGDSPYTKALAEIIRKPGLDVFQTFNQVGIAVKKATDGSQQPWFSISPIEGDFYFAGK